MIMYSVVTYKGNLAQVIAVRKSTAVIEFCTGSTLAVFQAALTPVGASSRTNLAKNGRPFRGMK